MKKIKFTVIALIIGISFSFGQKVRLGLPVGHIDIVYSAEFSPDGKKIVTASSDKTVKVWDCRTAKLIYSIEGHSGWVSYATFSPDGRTIVSSSGDSTAKVWESKTGKLLLSLKGHTDWVLFATYSPNGKSILTVSNDSTAKIWDSQSGKLIYTLKGHAGSVKSGRYSPDGKYIVTASDDSTVRIWYSLTGNLINSLDGHTDGVNSSAFSPDCKTIITASDDYTVKKWDSQTGRLIHSWEFETEVYTALYSPNGKAIIISHRDGYELLDSQTGEFIHGLGDHADRVFFATFSPDGKTIITASADQTAKIWDSQTGELLSSLRGQTEWIKSATYSPDEENIFTVNGDSTSIIWDTYSGKISNFLEGQTNYLGYTEIPVRFEYSVFNSNYSPDGKTLVTKSNDNLVKIWNSKTGKLLFWAKGDIATYSPNGKTIVTADNDTAKIWDCLNGKLLRSLGGHTKWIQSAVYSPDGNSILTSSGDNTAKIWDSQTGKLLHTLEGHKLTKDGHGSFVGITFAHFSPDGKYIITTARDNTAKIWDSKTGKLVHALEHHKLPEYDGKEVINSLSATYSPNGTYIVTTNIDPTVKIWDSQTGKLLHILKGHTQDVISIKFSPDERYMITRSNDNTAKLWNSYTGELINTFQGHRKLIIFAHFSPDGKKIITNSYDNTVKIHNSKTGRIENSLIGHSGIVKSAQYSPNREKIITTSHDNSFILWDAQSGECLTQFFVFDKSNWILLTKEKYYYSSKNANSMLYWIVNDTSIYTFEQFDLKYNRPDIVLERLGYASKELIDAYHKAYLKRLKKMGFKEEDLKDDFHVPESIIKNFEYLPEIKDSSIIELNLHFKDTKYKLDRINLWVNNVPIFGMTGIPLRDKNIQDYKAILNIQLVNGENKIQVSVINQAGAESYKETVYINHTPKNIEKPKLHIITIGVSDYQQPGWDLKYSTKDGRDIISLLKANKNDIWGKIEVDSLFNENVTIDKIKALKQKLLKTKVDDQVILFISGHGLLDDKLDFYFASHQMDFDDPAKKGIPYELLEGLLDSIPARKKVMLIDACHSGEVDKEKEYLPSKNEIAAMDDDQLVVSSYNTRGGKNRSNEKSKSKMGLQNSFELMQQLFTDLNKSSGAIVIAAAAGEGYALESAEWKNGAFTYSFLNGLRNNLADKSGDEIISISELKKYVLKKVEEITKGRQKPTVRNDNPDFDFRVW